jgi:hypothetical protein
MLKDKGSVVRSMMKGVAVLEAQVGFLAGVLSAVPVMAAFAIMERVEEILHGAVVQMKEEAVVVDTRVRQMWQRRLAVFAERNI